MDFKIGQKFKESYPPEVSTWCRLNNAECVAVEGGFEIKSTPEYVPTIQEQINDLENQVTQRRLREAMLGNKESIDFIEDIEKQIKSLREVI